VKADNRNQEKYVWRHGHLQLRTHICRHSTKYWGNDKIRYKSVDFDRKLSWKVVTSWRRLTLRQILRKYFARVGGAVTVTELCTAICCGLSVLYLILLLDRGAGGWARRNFFCEITIKLVSTWSLMYQSASCLKHGRSSNFNYSLLVCIVNCVSTLYRRESLSCIRASDIPETYSEISLEGPFL
jgi:hypothetical protein